jgi:hypothetical protein
MSVAHRRARRRAAVEWGKMPLSSELADAMLRRLDEAGQGRFDGPEMLRLRPLLELQARWSALPASGSLLAETLQSREGTHLFLYPFAGRHAHLGIASLIAWRASRQGAATFSMAVNDYGLELLSTQAIDWQALLESDSGGGAGFGRLVQQQRPSAASRRQPECGGTGAAPLPRDREGLRPCLPGVSWRRRRAPGNCRPRPGCSIRCFASMILATCC